MLLALAATAFEGPSPASAAEGRISYRLGYAETSPASAFSQTDVQSSPNHPSTLSQTFGFATDQAAIGLELAASLELAHPDYASSPLVDRGGHPSFLASKPETLSTLQGTYQRSTHLAALTTFTHLSPSPFATRGFSIRAGESFNSTATWVFLDFTYLTQDKPSDFYIDSEFRTVERPRLVHAQELSLAAEQLLTERWKARLRLLTSQRMEERPRNFGISLGQAYALDDRWFAKLEGNHVQESRADSLRDERGYLIASSIKGELTFEPAFDLLISAAYTIGIESEDRFSNSRNFQLGTDQYGLGISYPLKSVTLDAQTLYVESNTSAHALQISGGASWKL